jgi:hypothetical protein
LSVALIIGGLVAIAVAIWGKRFYDADVEGMPLRKERQVSPWWRKLIFGLVGAMLLTIGLVNLLRAE